VVVRAGSAGRVAERRSPSRSSYPSDSSRRGHDLAARSERRDAARSRAGVRVAPTDDQGRRSDGGATRYQPGRTSPRQPIRVFDATRHPGATIASKAERWPAGDSFVANAVARGGSPRAEGIARECEVSAEQGDATRTVACTVAVRNEVQAPSPALSAEERGVAVPASQWMRKPQSLRADGPVAG